MLVSRRQRMFVPSAYDLRHVGFVSDNPLAQKFPLADGEVSFQVPSVDPGCHYIVARECLPSLSLRDDVHRLPQSSVTLGISAHNLLLNTEKRNYATLLSVLRIILSDTVPYWTLDYDVDIVYLMDFHVQQCMHHI